MKVIEMKQRATPREIALFGDDSDVDDQRAAARLNTQCVVLVTNLTLHTKSILGFLHDVCATGMRIETSLPVQVGDEVRVDLPRFMVMAEVVHYAVGAQRYDAGLKLARPLNSEELHQCVRPDSWAKTLSPESRRPGIAAVVCR
jgi:hypothetical protein